MSHHSSGSATSTTSKNTTPSATLEESSSKSCSTTNSLKKQKNKDVDVPITDDFVLMSTPEKFKDTNINENNVVKRHRCDTSPNEKINLECLCLSDTSMQCGVPLHVQTILQHIQNSQLGQAELLFLLVYIVALESGYVGQTDYQQAKFYLDHYTTTSSFHAKNILQLSRIKPSYTVTEDKTRFTLNLHTLIDVADDSSAYLYSLLTGFVTGDFLIATLNPATSTNAIGFSTALSIGRYVLVMQAKNKPLHQRFCKLKELSYTLRNQLFVPMRCQQLGWLECCIYPSLDGMPFEIYDHILKYLNTNQLKILANVNKTLYNLTQSSKFKQPVSENLSTGVN